MAARSLFLSLNGTLAGQDRNGPVTAVGSGALRYQDGGAFVEEATTNHILNPRFVSVSTWSVASGDTLNVSGSPAATVTIGALTGTRILLCTTAVGSVTPGLPYSASAVIRSDRLGPRSAMQFRFLDAAGVTLGAALIGSQQETGNGDVEIKLENQVAPANASRIQYLIRFEVNTIIVGDVFTVREPQVEQKAYCTSYADGTKGPGYTWAGTAHASASTRAGAGITRPGSAIDANEFAVSFRASKQRGGPILQIGNNYGVALNQDDDGRARMIVYDNYGFLHWNYSPPLPFGADHTWYAHRSVRDDTMTLAIDGVIVIDMPAGPVRTTTDLLTLGMHDWGGGQADLTIRNVAAFDAPLTPTEQNHLTRLPDNLFAWDYLLPLPPLGPTGPGGEVTYVPRFFASDKHNAIGREIRSITGGTTDSDIDRAIKSTCRLTSSKAEDVRPYRWIATFVETREETGELDSRQTGLFRLGQPTIAGDEANATVTVSGSDVTVLLASYRTDDAYDFVQGTSCRQTLIDILGLVGLTRHAIPATDRTWAATHGHKPNVTALELFNDAVRIMGWHSVSATEDGRPTTRPYRELDTATPVRTYRIGESSELIGEIVTEANDAAFANVVYVTRDHPQLGYLQAEARNDNATSTYSTVHPDGPGVVAVTIQDNEIEDLAALQARANQELASRSIAVAGTLRTMPDLGLTVHDVIAIEIPDDAPHLQDAEGKWLVQQISYGYTPATAPPTIRIRRNEHD